MNNCYRCAMVLIVSTGCWVGTLATHAQGPRQTINYQSTDAEFLNPERGFYKFSILTENFTNQYDDIRANGDSLVYGLVVAENFRDGPLSESFLNKITAGFVAARRNGIKVKFRLAYNYSADGQDAPLPIVLNHIQQLQPIWAANKDVMFHMDAGFIGKWGEWHGSSSGLESIENRTAILEGILNALPTDRTVGIRYPHLKRHIFSGSEQSDALKITAENAFDGSNLTRVGHLNDCLWANEHDAGTYITPNWPRDRELEYVGGESRFAAHGGESCTNSEMANAENAIAEMEVLHTDYLNLDFQGDVIQRWRDSGHFDEIKRRLGYRYELKQVSLPAEVKPAGLLPLDFVIENVGFGELFNPRKVEVTLENNSTGERISAELSVDPRFWAGGETASVSTQLLLPGGMAEGDYTVGLWMPDIDNDLRDDVRYAIRFANENVWDTSTGINVLTERLVVSEDAAGPTYVSDGFSEVSDVADLDLLGDFNLDAEISGADFLVWQRNPSVGELSDWKSAYDLVTSVTVATVRVPEPVTGLLAATGIAACWSRRHRQLALDE